MRFRLPWSTPDRPHAAGERSEDRDDTPPPRPIATPMQPSAAGGPTLPATVVPRWVQLVLLPLGLLGLWALARAAGPVLLILVAASTLALILNPLIKRMQRVHVPRGLAILFVYLGMLAALIGVGILLANPVSTQANRFAKNVPSLCRRANHD